MTLEEQLKQVHAFTGTAGFLSNFAPYKPEEVMNHYEIEYRSNEHFYQAMKFDDVDIRERVADHAPQGLKKYVRSLGPINENWDQLKDDGMWKGLVYKFNLPRFRELLLSTKDYPLVESNYWGVCKGGGQNKLGKMLMKIRETL